MKRLEPEISDVGDEYKIIEYPGDVMTCICGYELIKEDSKTYRCTGGSHRVNMDDGSLMMDKFGNMMMKIPESMEGED